jgi:cell division transport system permease protein
MIFFWIKESLKLIGRAKSSFFLSLISTSISVLLIAACAIIIQASNTFQNNLKESVKINVFLKDNISKSETSKISKEISNKRFVKSVSYIDKNQAADNFIKETGEDFRKLLDYNPLPASFLVTIKGDFVQQDTLKKLISDFSKINGVDEVSFQQDFIYKLLQYLTEIKKYIFIITAVLFFISLYLVYSTVKLITTSKYEELETMKLVGAKLSTIKMPIVLNGVLIGLFASIISLGIFLIFFNYFNNYFKLYEIIHFRLRYFLGGMLLLGPVLGFFVSLISLRKITLKI